MNTGKIASFWQENAKGSGNPLLPDDIKNAIIDTGAVVVVTAIRLGASKFGETWFADIEVDPHSYGSGGPIEHWTTAQARNNVRDKLMERLIGGLKDLHAIPATMQQFEANGNYGWDFGPPPADWYAAMDSGESIALSDDTADPPY